MSYTIGQIIYGIPLCDDKDDDAERSDIIEEMIEEEGPGILAYYSGHAVATPVSFGVELDEIDECCAFIDIDKLKLVPTPKQLKKFEQLWNQLDPALQQEITATYGAPRVHILWSTS